MTTFGTAHQPPPDAESDPLEAAFAELPRPAAPGSLLPALVAGMPGAGGPMPFAVSVDGSDGVGGAAVGGGSRPVLLWIVAMTGVVIGVVIAAMLAPMLKHAPHEPDTRDRPMHAPAGPAGFDAFLQHNTNAILKDTDPCRILPPQVD